MNTVYRAVHAIIQRLLDVALPRRERTVRSEALRLESLSLSPSSHDLLGSHITTLLDYEDRRVADLIKTLKYDGSVKAAQLCAEVLAEYLIEQCAEDRQYSSKKIILVPVPLHASKQRERGFNQIEAVLRSLPKEFQDGSTATLSTDLLVRSRATAQQAKLHRSERLSNVAGAFALAHAVDLTHIHVFLIDDVTTTGATLVHAATPLRHAGAKVTLIALARA